LKIDIIINKIKIIYNIINYINIYIDIFNILCYNTNNQTGTY